MNSGVSLENVGQTQVSSSCLHVPFGCEQDVQGSQVVWKVGSLV